MKKITSLSLLLLLVVAPSTYAADQVEEVAPTTEVTETVEEEAVSEEVKYEASFNTLSEEGIISTTIILGEDFPEDTSGGRLFIKSSDNVTFLESSKNNIISEEDILDSSSAGEKITLVEFTSDGNEDVSGDLVTLSYEILEDTATVTFEILEENGGENSTIITSLGNEITISGSTTYEYTTEVAEEVEVVIATEEGLEGLNLDTPEEIDEISIKADTLLSSPVVDAEDTETETGPASLFLLSFFLVLGSLVYSRKRV